MKIKEFVKKNRRAITIAGIATTIILTDFIAYRFGVLNGVVYTTRKIAGVLSMEEVNDLQDRLAKTGDI